MIYKTRHRKLICGRRTSLTSVGELVCSGRVISSCSASDTRHVILVTNPVISPIGLYIVFIYLMNFPTWKYIIHVWKYDILHINKCINWEQLFLHYTKYSNDNSTVMPPN